MSKCENKLVTKVKIQDFHNFSENMDERRCLAVLHEWVSLFFWLVWGWWLEENQENLM